MASFNTCFGKEMDLVVKVLPGGANLVLTVDSSMTVRELKAELRTRLAKEHPDLTASRMFIVYQYRVLKDHQVLWRVLWSGCLIDLVLGNNYS